jgi:Flp pilus assembly protein TadD
MNRIVRPCLFVLLLSACAGYRPAPESAARAPSASALFARGMQLAARGDALRAEQYLVLAIRAGYPEQRAIVPLVRVCIASSRLRAALAHAQPYLLRHPDAWRLRYLTAAVHLALGQPVEAHAELRRLLALRPRAAHAHYLLGVTLRDGLGDLGGARASFEAYLQMSPHGARAPEVLAWLGEDTQRAAAPTADTALRPAGKR